MASMALNLAHRPLCSYASRHVTRAAASVALPSLPRPRLSGAAVPSRSSWRVLPWCLATLALAKSKDAKACQAEGHQNLRSVKLHSIEEGDSEATQIVVLVHGLDSWSGRKLSFLGVAKPFCPLGLAPATHSWGTWDSLMHLLAKRGIHTLAVDLRGTCETCEVAVVVFFKQVMGLLVLIKSNMIYTYSCFCIY